MTENTEMTIVDLVGKGRKDALRELRTLFNVTDLHHITAWVPVLVTMQGVASIHPDMLKEVGIETIKNFFLSEELNPEDSGDRAKVEPFIPMIDASIGAAAQAIMQNMQQQEALAQRGRPQITPGGLVV